MFLFKKKEKKKVGISFILHYSIIKNNYAIIFPINTCKARKIYNMAIAKHEANRR